MPCNITLEKIAEDLARAESGRPGRLGRHIASCEDCRRKVALLQRTDELASRALPEEPPAGIWEGVAARLEPRRRRMSAPLIPVFARGGVLAAATLLVAVVVLLQVRPVSQDGQDEMALLAERHRAVSAVSAAEEVPPVAVRIFGEAVDVPVRLPDWLPGGWRLVSLEKVTCPRGFPVAHLVYASGQKRLSVFQKPVQGGPGFGMGRGRGRMNRWGQTGGGGLQQFRGRPVAVAVGGGLRFTVMGDLPGESLQRIADSLAAGSGGSGTRPR